MVMKNFSGEVMFISTGLSQVKKERGRVLQAERTICAKALR